jgi:hypothetical protein
MKKSRLGQQTSDEMKEFIGLRRDANDSFRGFSLSLPHSNQ